MRRNAFTLIEVLMVILLISILAGMVTAAVRAAGDTAKRSRTRAIIATINDVLETKYESYKTRPLPVAVRNYRVRTDGTYASVVVQPRESARVRLMMIRDLMRMEMPDRMSDVLDNQSALTAAAQEMVQLADGSFVHSPWYSPNVNWGRPAGHVAFRDRVSADWTREHESAECLYMIMATTSMSGVPALSSIPSSNIGDTDNDGMPEILDGWGNPIGFIRWPVGYVDSNGSVPGIDIPDEFDTFRVDWSYVNGATGIPPAHPASPDLSVAGQTTFALRPLVVSAGPDGEHGIRFGFYNADFGIDSPITDPDVWAQEVQQWERDVQVELKDDEEALSPDRYEADIRYSQMTWPTALMGDDSLGRPGFYRYIDPYDRLFNDHRTGLEQRMQDNGLPRPAVGEPLRFFKYRRSGNREPWSDNITNYQLQETS